MAIDPTTGGVLAFVSNPTFDPNAFVGGIPYKLYSEYRDHLDKPLYNRALQGVYPPGSTIKPFTVAMALEGIYQSRSGEIAGELRRVVPPLQRELRGERVEIARRLGKYARKVHARFARIEQRAAA